jgi:uncharacterized protein YndB with AHSA1/START domain
MSETRTATTSIVLHAPAAKVWEALTRPELIKQYLFGTEVTTDWRAGSRITYRGVWEGKPYEDKGQILEIVPEKRLVSTFWSALSGLPDRPENYQTVRYELSPEQGGTRLTIIQDNNASEEDAKHAEGNWHMVLEGLQKVVESETHGARK